jgi:NADPH:quinone reductase-like Zn-dependent oxidoreductase
MKAYILKKGSENLDSLTQVEKADPKPGPGEILVRMRAASLNYRDQAVVTGNYFGGKVQRDLIPMSDGAGEVVEAGKGVSRFEKGDRVAGTFFQNWVAGAPATMPLVALGSPADGTLAEYVVFNEQDAVRIPSNLSFEEAATLPCAAVTAWNGLMVSSRTTPGETVLVLGTGGVSMFGLQFARAAGARVIVTSSSDDKLKRAKQLGAEILINRKSKPDWEQEVLKLTGGRGVDHIIEVGGVGTLAKSFQCVGHGGNIALIGVLAGFEGDTNPHALMLRGASLSGIFVGNRAMFEQMNRAIEVNGIQPVIDKVFPFDKAREAFEYHLSQAHFGKVVIAI